MGRDLDRPVKARGRPHRHGGRRRRSSSIAPNLMGIGPGGPVKTNGAPNGPGGATHTEPTSHGPRPGQAHQISRGWAAARSGPSNFQRTGRGRAQPINIFNFSRPGPANQFFKILGPARPIILSKARPGPARPVTSFRSARFGPAQTKSP